MCSKDRFCAAYPSRSFSLEIVKPNDNAILDEDDALDGSNHADIRATAQLSSTLPGDVRPNFKSERLAPRFGEITRYRTLANVEIPNVVIAMCSQFSPNSVQRDRFLGNTCNRDIPANFFPGVFLVNLVQE